MGQLVIFEKTFKENYFKMFSVSLVNYFGKVVLNSIISYFIRIKMLFDDV